MDDQHIVPIDEISGEGSSGHDQPAITMEMEQRFSKLLDEGGKMGAALGTDHPPAKIQKVRVLLRDHKHFVKYFEPILVSLGPIHHGKPKYQLGEKHKLILAYAFVQGCGCGESKKLLYMVKKEIKQLRECFEEEVTEKYDDETLAWMLFVDGCALLQYIFFATNDKLKELNMKIDCVTFPLVQDLFLLENQVPYGLLKLLMRYSGKEAELSESIERFIGIIAYQPTNPQQKHEQRDPTHLLDLLRTRLLGNRVQKEEESKASSPDQSYRNVQELKSAGIQLKRSKNNSYLRNISFTRKFGFYPGYLWLPPITVDESTGTKFKNLIAYEMCPDFFNDFGISSYIYFLDSLIDEVNDVKDMRKAHVLHNFLGSDQEVADLFNKIIGTDFVPNTGAYKDVKFQIQKYYENSWMTWMSLFLHDHFNSPWTILAFLGVLLGLALTAAQTWLAIFPHLRDNAKK
ncbi:hypothetical protein FH972_016720 [Carpinus fangiana]|uniref:Uncharacterized protein n=1 Tax=Carpinus fangiana TaxID=176857 RepID=A0A5N6RK23_9ROSI|nr:hypothetical protein FH972_016720 [Carpinus fangiana]